MALARIFTYFACRNLVYLRSLVSVVPNPLCLQHRIQDHVLNMAQEELDALPAVDHLTYQHWAKSCAAWINTISSVPVCEETRAHTIPSCVM